MSQTNMNADAEKKLKQMQKTIDLFKDKLLAKFEGYITGIALLPPGKSIYGAIDEQTEELPKEKISVMILIDDTDSQKMTKLELKERLSQVISNIAKEVDENIFPQTMIHSELWQYCYDSKYELLQLLAVAAPVYDNGMLAAIKIAEVHKNMVLKKFDKYIVSYVLAGSLVQGRATPESDIDVFIVIDDTDVKKMTRVELKDKLRAIIIGMSGQASEMTGIKKAFNIQTYILTDFWDSIKEANPVIFTFLRDGVPFYDRGVFMPWKQLLQMGKVKPSMEAIDMYMNTGEQMLERTQLKLKEIGMEDTFWSILYPSQAALMLYGLPPPTPKETPELLRKVFVKKEKILEEKYVKILDDNIKLRKELEHGSKKSVTGAQIDECMQNAKAYLDRIKKLFSDIQQKQMGQSLVHAYDHVVSIVRDILKMQGIKKKITEKDMLTAFKEHIVDEGHLPQKFYRSFESLTKAKQEHDDAKLHKSEAEKMGTQAQELIRALVEYIQRKRGSELEKVKIKLKHGEKFGEVLLFDDQAFIIHDVEVEEKQYSKAKISKTGGLMQIKESSAEEFEKALVDMKKTPTVFVKDQLFVDLKKVFGKDVQILLHS